MTENTRLNADELEAIRKRAEAATEGPWGWAKFALDDDDWDTEMPWLGNATEAVMDFGDCEQYYPTQGTPPNSADAEFIAHAREDVPKLLAEIERLKEIANILCVELHRAGETIIYEFYGRIEKDLAKNDAYYEKAKKEIDGVDSDD
jgi:hypothetical protein